MLAFISYSLLHYYEGVANLKLLPVFSKSLISDSGFLSRNIVFCIIFKNYHQQGCEILTFMHWFLKNIRKAEIRNYCPIIGRVLYSVGGDFRIKFLISAQSVRDRQSTFDFYFSFPFKMSDVEETVYFYL